MRPGQDESRAVVIERGIQPGAGAVALVAACREVRRHVIRICHSLIIRLMTRVAGGTRQVVIVVPMAIRALAWRQGVHSG